MPRAGVWPGNLAAPRRSHRHWALHHQHPSAATGWGCLPCRSRGAFRATRSAFLTPGCLRPVLQFRSQTLDPLREANPSGRSDLLPWSRSAARSPRRPGTRYQPGSEEPEPRTRQSGALVPAVGTQSSASTCRGPRWWAATPTAHQ